MSRTPGTTPRSRPGCGPPGSPSCPPRRRVAPRGRHVLLHPRLVRATQSSTGVEASTASRSAPWPQRTCPPRPGRAGTLGILPVTGSAAQREPHSCTPRRGDAPADGTITGGEAAIVGVADAASPTGELDTRGHVLEAAMIREALDDAGLTLDDVDGICCSGLATGIAEYLDLHPALRRRHVRRRLELRGARRARRRRDRRRALRRRGRRLRVDATPDRSLGPSPPSFGPMGPDVARRVGERRTARGCR